MKPICVIDNSTLVNLTNLEHLRVFRHLRSLFCRIYVPETIRKEYERMLVHDPNRQGVIDSIGLNQFLGYCPDFDLLDFNLLKMIKGIDAGEAEAVAQHLVLNSQFVLSDDQDFIKALETSELYIRVMSTIHLIAWLDMSGVIPNPVKYLKTLYNHSPFTSNQLRLAYLKVAGNLSINLSKKDLNKKTSIKTLGIN